MKKNLPSLSHVEVRSMLFLYAVALYTLLSSPLSLIAQSQLIKDVNPDENPFIQEYTEVKSDGAGNIYFISEGKQLWKINTNVTPQKAIIIKSMRSVSNVTVVGSNVFFVGEDGSGKELWKTNTSTVTAQKVKDIWSGSRGSNPSYLTNINGVLYFAANNGTHGNELWKSNGTEAGTVMVKDFNPGSENGDPAWMTEMNGMIYLAATGPSKGNELWRTNGTSSGTAFIKDLYPGSTGSSPSNLTKANGKIYFSATHPSYGKELWITDGTSAGTAFLKDVNPGSASSHIDNITALGNTCYFSADDGTNGVELWKSNPGTGTTKVTSYAEYCEEDENSEYYDPECERLQLLYFRVIGNGLYYVKSNMGNSQIYRVDGTNGTIKNVFDLGYGGFNPRYTEMGGSVYFFKYAWTDFKPDDPSNEEQQALQLFKMSMAGTDPILVKNYYHPVTFGAGELPRTEMAVANNQLYFPGILNEGDGYKMLRYDPTSNTTYIIRDTYIATLSSNPRDMMNINGITIFTTGDNDLNTNVWRTDGTAEGTYQLMQFNDLYEIAASGNSVYVIGARVYGTEELWKTDGTQAGTILLKQFDTSSFGHSYTQMLDGYGTLYFVSDQGELWKTNGTPSSTIMLKDFDRINYLGKGGGRAIISATVAGRHELWRSSGTVSSTIKLKTIHESPRHVSPITERVTANDIFYFIAETVTHGHEVWRSNGTSSGTYMLTDLRQNDLHEYEDYNLTAFRDSLYFTAQMDNYKFALYKSNGTKAGTRKVADVEHPFELIPGDQYLSIFTSSAEGLDVWSTRGTASSTIFIKHLEPTHFFSDPSYVVVDGVTYFTSDRARYLWRTDGTECGTFTLNTPAYPYPLIQNGTNLFFGAYTERYGREPYRLSLSSLPASPCASFNTLVQSQNMELDFVEYGPNPFTERLTLKVNKTQSENAFIAVKSFTGEIVHRAENIDTSYSFGEDLPKGIYIVEVIVNGQIQTFRILKR